MKDKKLRILLLDTKSSNPNHYLCLAVEEALALHPLVESVFCCDYSNALATAIESRANFFLAFDGEDPDLSLCSRLAAVCGRSAVWFTEDPYETDTNVATSKIFDLVFTNDQASIGSSPNTCAGYGVNAHHLPLAAAESFHFHKAIERDSIADRSRNSKMLVGTENHFYYDLLFVGTAWPNRVSFLSELLPLLPDIKYKIALPTNAHLPKFTLPIPSFEYNWKTCNVDFARLANRSRIVLSLHRDFSNSGNGRIASTPGPRLFEVALAGGFQLISSELRDVNQFYNCEGHLASEITEKDGTQKSIEPSELVTFSGPKDCAKKVLYYLNNPDERIKIAKRAQDVTLNRHLYLHRVNKIVDLIGDLPAKSFGKQINSSTDQVRRRLLFVTHNTINSEVFGGVEVSQDLLADGVAGQFDVYFFVPTSIDSGGFSTGVLLLNSDYDVIEQMSFQTENNLNNFRSYQRELFFKNILIKYGIEIVHYQHLIGHCLSLPLVSKQLGIPSLLSCHDYYLACDNFNLINHENVYCRADKRDLSACDVCLGATRGKGIGYQAARRTFCDQVLAGVDLLLFNTQGVQDIFMSFYGNRSLLKKARIHPPSIQEPKETDSPKPSVPWTMENPLNVVSFGNFLPSKGSEVQLSVFENCQNLPIRFFIMGNVPELMTTRLKKMNLKNVQIVGNFKQGNLSEVLAPMELSIHLSLWPETYCLTLSEAWRNGLVPIVTDIGALGERVQEGINGFKINVKDAASAVRLLSEILVEPELLHRVRRNITPELWDTRHDIKMLEEYNDLIETWGRTTPPPGGKHTPSVVFLATKVGQLGTALQEVNSVLPRGDLVDLLWIWSSNILNLFRRLYFHIRYTGIKGTAIRIFKRLSNAKH